jgi:maleate cis-trans isomerase
MLAHALSAVKCPAASLLTLSHRLWHHIRHAPRGLTAEEKSIMMGWRARLGFLVPPGNPTVEPEMMQLAPCGVTVHFSRLTATGPVGTLVGQAARNRSYLEHIDASAALLAMVRPTVMVLAHTASSYSLGQVGEAQMLSRLHTQYATPVITAAGAVLQALAYLGVHKIALGTPYDEATSQQGKAHLEAHGLHVVGFGRLPNVHNIYEEPAERAYQLARLVDTPEAEAVFISGTGLPTLSVLDMLEHDLGKPVLSSNAAMMWLALSTAQVRHPIPGYGRLLATLS